MAQVCLDGEVTIEFLRGERSVIEKLRYYADNEEICVTSFALIQLMMGIRKTEVIEPFIENVGILTFDKKAAHTATRILSELRENRINASMDAVFTASVCIANDAFLFTNDRKKYEGIKGLKLV